jgi:tripartite-type tricarboxylate transporter receptor subunit TctC
MNLTRTIALAVACFGLASTSAMADSQTDRYPERPVKIVVPWAPGGFTDRLGRMLAEKMTKSLNQSVIVENRPGASGSIGSENVARAAPDGYTLLLTTSDSTVRLMQDKRIDSAADYAMISLLATQPVYLAVGPKMPAKTIGEFIAAARSQPGQITYASSGEGSAVHLAMELFAAAAGIKLNHIPYKGMGPALTDLLGGQVDAVLLSMQGSSGNFETGRLRPLAITSPKRSALMPQVPTVAESGYPSYQLMLWYGLVAPKGTPKAIIDKVNREVKAALAMPDIQAQLKDGGTDPVGSSPAELASFVDSEVAKWGAVIK